MAESFRERRRTDNGIEPVRPQDLESSWRATRKNDMLACALIGVSLETWEPPASAAGGEPSRSTHLAAC